MLLGEAIQHPINSLRRRGWTIPAWLEQATTHLGAAAWARRQKGKRGIQQATLIRQCAQSPHIFFGKAEARRERFGDDGRAIERERIRAINADMPPVGAARRWIEGCNVHGVLS